MRATIARMKQLEYSLIKIKINVIFFFTLLCRATKGFMKAFKALIKHFEAPQRNVKIKILS